MRVVEDGLARSDRSQAKLARPFSYAHDLNVRVRQLIAWSHWTRADILAGAIKPAEADAEYRLSIAGYVALAVDFPKNREYRFNQAQVLWQIGQTWVNAGMPSKGRADLLNARTILDQLTRDGMDDDSSRKVLESVNEMLTAK